MPGVILTETDVVGEEMQEALTLFLPVATGVARAPGSYAGSGVVNVVGCDGAACREGWRSVIARLVHQEGTMISLLAALLGSPGGEKGQSQPFCSPHHQQSLQSIKNCYRPKEWAAPGISGSLITFKNRM